MAPSFCLDYNQDETLLNLVGVGCGNADIWPRIWALDMRRSHCPRYTVLWHIRASSTHWHDTRVATKKLVQS